MELSRLDAFLALPDVSELRGTFNLGKRIGKDGKTIDCGVSEYRAATEQELNSIRQRTGMKVDANNNITSKESYNLLLVTECVVSPDFSNSEALSKAGCGRASELISKKIPPGTIGKIAGKILALSCFDEDTTIDEVNEAKN